MFLIEKNRGPKLVYLFAFDVAGCLFHAAAAAFCWLALKLGAPIGLETRSAGQNTQIKHGALSARLAGLMLLHGPYFLKQGRAMAAPALLAFLAL